MRSLSNITIFSKQTCKINFSGGELSSDSGILCVSEFIEKIGLSKFLESIFDAEISSLVTHKPSRVILQKVLQIIAGYDADDHAVLQQLRIPGGVQGYTSAHSKLQVFRCDNRIDNLCSLKTKPC